MFVQTEYERDSPKSRTLLSLSFKSHHVSVWLTAICNFMRADFIRIVVQLLSRVWLFVTRWTAALQAPCPLPSPEVCSHSWPLSWWCYLTISSSVAPFSFCLQSFTTSAPCSHKEKKASPMSLSSPLGFEVSKAAWHQQVTLPPWPWAASLIRETQSREGGQMA